jgi:hypothetical protein
MKGKYKMTRNQELGYLLSHICNTDIHVAALANDEYLINVLDIDQRLNTVNVNVCLVYLKEIFKLCNIPCEERDYKPHLYIKCNKIDELITLLKIRYKI